MGLPLLLTCSDKQEDHSRSCSHLRSPCVPGNQLSRADSKHCLKSINRAITTPKPVFCQIASVQCPVCKPVRRNALGRRPVQRNALGRRPLPSDGTLLGLHCFAMHRPFNETPNPSDGTPNSCEACEACEACPCEACELACQHMAIRNSTLCPYLSLSTKHEGTTRRVAS